MKSTFTIPPHINLKRARSITTFMSALPGTHGQITARSSLNKSTVGKLIIALHGKGVRISKWLPHPVRGPSLAVYAEGTEPDALDTVPRLTKRQIYERYEAGIKGTERADQRLARYRSRHWLKKAAATPHSWASALFGAAGVPVVNAEG
jgi:hypothetical protein